MFSSLDGKWPERAGTEETKGSHGKWYKKGQLENNLRGKQKKRQPGGLPKGINDQRPMKQKGESCKVIETHIEWSRKNRNWENFLDFCYNQ